MSTLKSNLSIVTTAVAAALLVAFTPLAQSAGDYLDHELGITDGAVPNPEHEKMKADAAKGVKEKVTPPVQRTDQTGPSGQSGTYFDHERQLTDGAGPNPAHDKMKADAAKGQLDKGAYVQPAKGSATGCRDPWAERMRQSDGYNTINQC